MALAHVSVGRGGANALHLARDSYAFCVQQRAQGVPQTLPLILRSVRILDALNGELNQVLLEVEIVEGRIEDIRPCTHSADMYPAACVVIECDGMTLMPGLCDAHVHVTAVTADLAALASLSESLVTARAAAVMGGMLQRGFTTVRDAGGADWGLARAVEEGAVLGPRLLFTGHALSQTGGHGDFRSPGEECCACGVALRGVGRVCDGDAEVRRAARDELRRGAHCVKVMASGGVASPTDRLTSTQFSPGELRAAVEEAQAVGTYVCAHAYMPNAIMRALQAGVRSIEHGNWMDEATGRAMAAAGAFLVPTTITYAALRASGVKAGMPKALVTKVGAAVEQGVRCMALARELGVRMAFGSDLLGELHPHQGEEFLLRAAAGLSPAEVLRSATVTAAELFQLQGSVGAVAVGMTADLLLVDGNPLEDISLLASPPGEGAVVTPQSLAALSAALGGVALGARCGGPPALAAAAGAAAERAARGASPLRLVLKGGLLAVVPLPELERVNRELYRPVG